MRTQFVILVLLSVFLVSCKSEREKQWEQSSVSERLFELQSRGWRSNQLLNFKKDIQYRATQVPIEYYLLKNHGTANVVSFDSLVQRSAQERIVEFEFEHVAGDDLINSEFTDRSNQSTVTYMSAAIQNDFYAVTHKGDTIRPAGVLFERHFNVSPVKRLMLYFSGIPEGEDIKLIYNDQLFKNGQFEFDFQNAPIQL